MFQSKEYIQKRHGKTGTDRAYFLNQLANEYKTTTNVEAKHQVLANLANFAYDPVNYNTFWDLGMADLFLEATVSEDMLLREFGMGGLANICLDPRFQKHITSDESHLENIKSCLQTVNTNNNLLVNTISTLMQIITETNYTEILTEDLKEKLFGVYLSTAYRHAKNMAAIFLLDYYHISVEGDVHLESSSNA